MSRKILATVFYSYLFVTKKVVPDKVTIYSKFENEEVFGVENCDSVIEIAQILQLSMFGALKLQL